MPTNPMSFVLKLEDNKTNTSEKIIKLGGLAKQQKLLSLNELPKNLAVVQLDPYSLLGNNPFSKNLMQITDKTIRNGPSRYDAPLRDIH